MRKVLILDTSILCVWLRVPGKETCGPDNARMTYESVSQKLELEINQGTTLIMPLASIIETGNHIAQINGDKFDIVNAFVDHIDNAIDGRVPWAAFTEQSPLINGDALKQILATWRQTALSGQSLGDAMIVEVAKYYASYGVEVEIYTGDVGLRSYTPLKPNGLSPRRRR